MVSERKKRKGLTERIKEAEEKVKEKISKPEEEISPPSFHLHRLQQMVL